MARTNARCPSCGKRMKYLFKLVYRNATSKNGKKSNMWAPEKRAIYCNTCDEIYKLELEAELCKISKSVMETTEKFKI